MANDLGRGFCSAQGKVHCAVQLLKHRRVRLRLVHVMEKLCLLPKLEVPPLYAVRSQLQVGSSAADQSKSYVSIQDRTSSDCLGGKGTESSLEFSQSSHSETAIKTNSLSDPLNETITRQMGGVDPYG